MTEVRSFLEAKITKISETPHMEDTVVDMIVEKIQAGDLDTTSPQVRQTLQCLTETIMWRAETRNRLKRRFLRLMFKNDEPAARDVFNQLNSSKYQDLADIFVDKIIKRRRKLSDFPDDAAFKFAVNMLRYYCKHEDDSYRELYDVLCSHSELCEQGEKSASERSY